MGLSVSVAICTYNGEKYIYDQIKSIIDQTRRPDEIIIFDDASYDNTINEIKRAVLNYNGVCKLFINKKNVGYEKNFYQAICATSGDIVFLSDQDDVWMKNKIEKIEKIFYKEKDISLVVHDVEVCDSDLHCIQPSTWNYEGFCGFSENEIFKSVLEGNHVQGCASAVRKEMISSFGKSFPNEVSHDAWIGLICAMYGKIYYTNDVLLKYRQHANNTLGARASKRVQLLTGIQGIKIFLDSYQKTLQRSLNGKKWIVKNVDTGKCNGLFLEKCKFYIEFLQRRLKIISNGNAVGTLHLVGMVKKYIGFSYNKKRALKSMIEDVLLLILKRRFDN